MLGEWVKNPRFGVYLVFMGIGLYRELLRFAAGFRLIHLVPSARFLTCRCRFLNNAHEKTAVVMAAALFFCYTAAFAFFLEKISSIFSAAVSSADWIAWA